MKKIILDVDTGIDDALAIAYAALSSEIQLLGITTSYGMAPVEYTFRNSRKIVEMLGKNIPVYKGSKKPLVLERIYSGKIHGEDGLGNTLGAVVDTSGDDRKDAVDFIIEQVRKHKKELTLVTTGPLTNLATVLKKDPAIIDMIGQVVSMGGAFMTPGNVNKFAEANITIDPHAANRVFKSKLPITMVGLDVTRKTLLTKRDVDVWREKNTDVSNFFADFVEYYLNAYKELHPYLEGCALHDPLAVAVAKNPNLVKTVPMFVTVDLDEGSLGRTTEDLYRRDLEVPNTKVSVQVNAEEFMSDFFSIVI